MVADALERLRYPDDVERRADGARVFHHVGDELAQHRLELGVDHRVLADHFRRGVAIQASERIERPAQHRDRRFGGMAHVHRTRQAAARLVLVDVLAHARDLLRLVADTLEVGDGLGDGEDQAQVVRRRLALDDHVAALAVERHLHAVHLVIGGDDVVEQRQVAGLQAVERAPDLRLDQPAHLEHARADRLQLGVELLGEMLAHRHVGCHYDKSRHPV